MHLQRIAEKDIFHVKEIKIKPLEFVDRIIHDIIIYS